MVLLPLLLKVVVFLTIITVLVAAHEYGHYLFARIFKMGVEEFAIGFGKKPLFVWARKKRKVPMDRLSRSKYAASNNIPYDEVPAYLDIETIYTMRPFPVGGFVRILGMTPQEDGSEVNVLGGFYSRPIWQRVTVLFAGPLFSVLAGVLVLFVSFMSFGKYSTDPVIDKVSPDGPAYTAGLRNGDRITRLGDKKISTFAEMADILEKSQGKPIQVGYSRSGKEFAAVVSPTKGLLPSEIADGATKADVGPDRFRLHVYQRRQKVAATVGGALATSLIVPVDMFQGLAAAVMNIGNAKDNVGGPVEIASTTGRAVDQGLETVIQFAAQLSISVGLLNLSPILPFLDGGQIAIALIEALRRGRRLSFQVQNTVMGLGLVLGLVLIATVTVRDVQRNLTPAKTPPPQAATK